MDYAAYFEEIKRLQDKYAGQIALKQGMEFGIQIYTVPQFEELFFRFAFGFIICSCHQVEEKSSLSVRIVMRQENGCGIHFEYKKFFQINSLKY